MLALPLYDDSPRARLPLITVGLITACCVAFLWQLGLDENASEKVSLSAYLVLRSHGNVVVTGVDPLGGGAARVR